MLELEIRITMLGKIIFPDDKFTRNNLKKVIENHIYVKLLLHS